MRVAVTLPSLPAASPLRQALVATLSSLRARGVELEAFAEDPRDVRVDGIPAFHYLRLRERWRAAPFDNALYPLGRDWRPYEPSLVLMHELPGIVWVLDPVPHHLTVGGLAMRGWWDEYRELLERSVGEKRGGDLAMTVAAGWAVRSTYRRFDPTPAMLAGQRAVCAATPEIAAVFRRDGTVAPVVPVPPPATTAATRSRSRCRRILLLTFHYGWPEPVLRALKNLIAQEPSLELRVVVPELLQQVAIGPRSVAMGIEDRMAWPIPDDELLDREVREADMVVHLRDDPTAGELALMDRGLALGAPSILLRAPGVRTLPDALGLRVEPGRSLQQALEGQVLALVRDDELFRAISAEAMRYAAVRPGVEESAERLVALVDETAGATLTDPPVSEAAWRRLRGTMRDAVLPAGAARDLEQHMAAIAEGAIPERLRRRGNAR